MDGDTIVQSVHKTVNADTNALAAVAIMAAAVSPAASTRLN